MGEEERGNEKVERKGGGGGVEGGVIDRSEEGETDEKFKEGNERGREGGRMWKGRGEGERK